MKAKGYAQAEIDALQSAEEQQRVSDEARAYLRETDWPVIREAERFLVREGYLTAEFGEERDAARDRVT